MFRKNSISSTDYHIDELCSKVYIYQIKILYFVFCNKNKLISKIIYLEIKSNFNDKQYKLNIFRKKKPDNLINSCIMVK